MGTYPDSSGFVYEDAFPTDIDVIEPVFLIVIFKDLAIIFIDALIGSKPKVTLFVFSDGKDLVVYKTIWRREIGQCFFVILHHSFANGAKP